MCKVHLAPVDKAALEERQMATASTQKYFESLLASYDVMVSATEKAKERGITVSRQFAQDIVKGQREAIELGKKLSGEPTDVGLFYTAILESATAAQGRALSFAQLAYQEALAAGTDARETVEQLVGSTRETTQAAMEAARAFAASAAEGPAELIQKATKAATTPRKAKSAS